MKGIRIFHLRRPQCCLDRNHLFSLSAYQYSAENLINNSNIHLIKLILQSAGRLDAGTGGLHRFILRTLGRRFRTICRAGLGVGELSAIHFYTIRISDTLKCSKSKHIEN
jgi:hypothetical protein